MLAVLRQQAGATLDDLQLGELTTSRVIDAVLRTTGIASAITGAAMPVNPHGSPRLRNVLRVESVAASSHSQVVSIGNGPWAVRMTKRRSGTRSRFREWAAVSSSRNALWPSLLDEALAFVAAR